MVRRSAIWASTTILNATLATSAGVNDTRSPHALDDSEHAGKAHLGHRRRALGGQQRSRISHRHPDEHHKWQNSTSPHLTSPMRIARPTHAWAGIDQAASRGPLSRRPVRKLHPQRNRPHVGAVATTAVYQGPQSRSPGAWIARCRCAGCGHRPPDRPTNARSAAQSGLHSSTCHHHTPDATNTQLTQHGPCAARWAPPPFG